jgi:hypothetical protein
MMNRSPYPHLQQFIGCYFHEDCEGDRAHEVVQAYIRESVPTARELVMRDIDKLKKNNPGTVEEVYRKEFNDNIDLSYWGFTYETFLDEIQRLLKNSL